MAFALSGLTVSGKSNVVDAIKWALGEQARRLRRDDMTGVIFNIGVPFVARSAEWLVRQHPRLLPRRRRNPSYAPGLSAAVGISSTVRRSAQVSATYQRRGARVPRLRRHQQGRVRRFARIRRTAARRARGGGRLGFNAKKQGSAPTRTGRTELAAPFGYRRQIEVNCGRRKRRRAKRNYRAYAARRRRRTDQLVRMAAKSAEREQLIAEQTISPIWQISVKSETAEAEQATLAATLARRTKTAPRGSELSATKKSPPRIPLSSSSRADQEWKRKRLKRDSSVRTNL